MPRTQQSSTKSRPGNPGKPDPPITKKVVVKKRRNMFDKYREARKRQETTLLKAKTYQGTFDRFARTVFAACDHGSCKETPTRANAEALKQLANISLMATANLMRRFDQMRSVQGHRKLAPSHIDSLFRTDPSALTLVSIPDPVRV